MPVWFAQRQLTQAVSCCDIRDVTDVVVRDPLTLSVMRETRVSPWPLQKPKQQTRRTLRLRLEKQNKPSLQMPSRFMASTVPARGLEPDMLNLNGARCAGRAPAESSKCQHKDAIRT